MKKQAFPPRDLPAPIRRALPAALASVQVPAAETDTDASPQACTDGSAPGSCSSLRLEQSPPALAGAKPENSVRSSSRAPARSARRPPRFAASEGSVVRRLRGAALKRPYWILYHNVVPLPADSSLPADPRRAPLPYPGGALGQQTVRVASKAAGGHPAPDGPDPGSLPASHPRVRARLAANSSPRRAADPLPPRLEEGPRQARALLEDPGLSSRAQGSMPRLAIPAGPAMLVHQRIHLRGQSATQLAREDGALLEVHGHQTPARGREQRFQGCRRRRRRPDIGSVILPPRQEGAVSVRKTAQLIPSVDTFP